ncbi:ATP-binding response regulator [Deinococcus misasensis]|uniref:ATP-binding response regulator n=1 Tax=Deinococcus misasensis TaxID=392413 RepID=UPI0009FF36A1|nr:ATP-binding protein [Deinococcus misasensis]
MSSMSSNESHPTRILIVEDSPTDTDILKRHLKRWSPSELHITSVSYGKEGLQAFSNDPAPELVFLDLDLPDMTGLDFLNAFPEHHKPPAVIILTGSGDENSAVKAMKAGALDYLVKGNLSVQTLQKTIQNATDKHRLQKELHLTRRQLESLIQQSPIGMALLDRDLTVRQANQVFIAATGYPDVQSAHLSLHDLSNDLMQGLCQLGKQVVETQKSIKAELETRNMFWKVQIYPAAFDQGRVQWVGLSLEDISERKHAEKRLSHLHATQKRFVADAAHELRNPLTTIQGNLDILVRHQSIPEADRQDIISDVQREANRLGRLVNDMLTLARGDSGAIVQEEPVELHTLLLDSWQDFVRSRKSHRFQLQSVEPAWVLGDHDRLKQLLLILLDNAVKYTPSGGTITLGLKNTPDGVHWVVQDSGIGISEADLKRVFERFFRSDPSRQSTGDPGGTGLGLSIAQWIVEQHHGVIHLDSTIGKGTTVTVMLPSHPPVDFKD